CCHDKHTRAQALPVIIYGRPSPLFPDFLAQLDRRKHISARGAEEYCQLINVWTDGPNQLNGLTRHSVVDLAINLHAADACVTVQVVNIGDPGGWFLIHWQLRGEWRQVGETHQPYRAQS